MNNSRDNILTRLGRPQVFPAGPGTVLRLRDLPGRAVVVRGEAGQITVTVDGDPAVCEQVRAELVDGVVEVSGRRPGGCTVIGGNRRVIVSQSVDAVAAGQPIVGLSAGVIDGNVMVAGGRIVVNGVDVTDQVNQVNGETGPAMEPARVELQVPAGTVVEVEDCVRSQVLDVGGRVEVDLSGQAAFAVRGATGARLDLSGQAHARLLDGTGDVTLDVSGQSRAEVDGRHEELRVDVCGMSAIVARGEFERVAGRASGMSTVTVTGQVTSHSLRATGMATATVNGRAVTR